MIFKHFKQKEKRKFSEFYLNMADSADSIFFKKCFSKNAPSTIFVFSMQITLKNSRLNSKGLSKQQTANAYFHTMFKGFCSYEKIKKNNETSP